MLIISFDFLSKILLPTPRISNGGLLVVLRFALRSIAGIPGQVIALKSATAHTRKRWQQTIKYYLK